MWISGDYSFITFFFLHHIWKENWQQQKRVIDEFLLHSFECSKWIFFFLPVNDWRNSKFSAIVGCCWTTRKMKILPASNASGASSTSSSTSSQVSGLKLGIVRLGRAAGKVLKHTFSIWSTNSPIFFFFFILFFAFICHSSVLKTIWIQFNSFFFSFSFAYRVYKIFIIASRLTSQSSAMSISFDLLPPQTKMVLPVSKEPTPKRERERINTVSISTHGW